MHKARSMLTVLSFLLKSTLSLRAQDVVLPGSTVQGDIVSGQGSRVGCVEFATRDGDSRGLAGSRCGSIAARCVRATHPTTLGKRYSQHFVNHWAFVRFAREQNLGLDFTTPPKRPDPRESVKRMLEILDRSDFK